MLLLVLSSRRILCIQYSVIVQHPILVLLCSNAVKMSWKLNMYFQLDPHYQLLCYRLAVGPHSPCTKASEVTDKFVNLEVPRKKPFKILFVIAEYQSSIFVTGDQVRH